LYYFKGGRKVAVNSAADLMVMLLYARGKSGEYNEEIKGITRMEKLMYLLLKEGGFMEILSEEVTFEAYDFGPYSSEIYDLLESLKEMGILKVREKMTSNLKNIIDIYYAESQMDIKEITKKPMGIYSLIENRGFKIAKKLLDYRVSKAEFDRIEHIKVKYNFMDLSDLLGYVYKTYPDSAKKSKIIEKIFGFGRRPDLKLLDREGEK